MAKDARAPVSPVTKAYQEAMSRLSAGDLGFAVKALLRIHEENPDTEEAFFAEEQLARVRRLWSAEAEKAGLTADAWKALQERAAKRRAGLKPPAGAAGVIALVLAISAWSALMAAAPRVAFLGRLDSVPPIFRIVAVVVAVVTLITGFGLMKMKWEAVNLFIVISPIFMIVTFIGVTEAADMTARVLCVLALAAQAAAAWYMSKQSHRFIF